jgi:flagella basal body P-ring formation protein FlgA
MIRAITRPTLRNVALLLALAAPFATPAVAQSGSPAQDTDPGLTAMPTLRAEATVTGDLVHIGDLVKNAGKVAGVAIFRSPDLGTRGAVSADRVIDALQPYGLEGVDSHGLNEVVVSRASRPIAEPEITAAITKALAGHFGLGDASNIVISFDRPLRTLQVEPTASGEIQIVSLGYDPRSTRFDVTIDLPSSAVLHRQSVRFIGTAIETVAAVAVAHPVERGEVLKASDLVTMRRPKTGDVSIAAIADAIGLAARHALRPDQPLHAADLMKPELVQRNDTVTIVYEAPGLMLTLRGQAQDSGGLGDSIGVLNVETKRKVQGVISGPGRVTVNALPSRVVDYAAVPAPVADAAQQPE